MSPPVELGDILFLPWSSVYLSQNRVRSVTPKPFEIFSCYMRRRAERKNHNSGLRILELGPFEFENSSFWDMVVSAL